ncbi:phosphoribosylformylglycinamidine synthase I [Candidatus Micrarchaeota archaeon]|nr:phosphoribosylformylglycinamidine synthase I [Candidatus Micrarchaeota archaeon]MBU2476224.1 phosphoribosylformylglycinamidine synthase I [Candidatus Micrarchaeota archaeon]
MNPKIIVLRTAGTNCDYETVNVFKYLGAEVDLVHVNSLQRKEISLSDYHCLVLPGGFADGDYISSAKILANKLKYNLREEIENFISEKKLILGICNGFQALVKAGFLPAINNFFEQQVTLLWNQSGHFQDEWITMKKTGGKHCVWTKEIESVYCPINHGEGRLEIPENTLKELYEKDLVVFKYEKNPNGSMDSIAGICDETGRIFGLMPHPEKNAFSLTDPRSTREQFGFEGEGISIFRNGVTYIRENLF